MIQSCGTGDGESSADSFKGVPVIEPGEPMDSTDDHMTDDATFYFSGNHYHHIAMDRRGHILVSNRGDNTILHFNEHGDFIGRIGSSGQGPGEFQNRLVVPNSERSVFTGRATGLSVMHYLPFGARSIPDTGPRNQHREADPPTAPAARYIRS